MKKIFLLVALATVISCNQMKKEPVADASSNAVTSGAGAPLARFNGEAITDDQIRKIAGTRLVMAEIDLYDARKEALDQFIQDRLIEEEIKKQGVSRNELIQKNVLSKVNVADKEVQKFYDDNKGRFEGKGFEEMKPRIQAMLTGQQNQEKMQSYVEQLKKQAKIEFLVVAPKLEIPEGDAPSMGPKDAPIRLVEYTDYECPFCGRARDSVNQVLKEYKGKVRYVIKDFPLSFHKNAFKAHEAAHCAGDQGKYWEMNGKIWADQRAITEEDLKKHASEIKLKTKEFEECLSSGKFAALVRQNIQEGQDVGVSGTPAFFINGRPLSGARPFEAFKEIIDGQLSGQ
ncbi:MAG: thioredoxin domain-containing protein [Deltaproteobacteria bacterium]|nr:thioredoxin domain-containing protein [Deltaproteobacteria bacterium]